MPPTRRWIPRGTHRVAIAALALAALAACENGRFRSNVLLDFGLKAVGLGQGTAEAPVERPSIGPPLIVGYNDIRVGIPGVGKRGDSPYYIASDGVEIALNNGMVTRVIGLGLDLQGMYLAPDGPYLNDLVAAAREKAIGERVADYYVKGRIVHDTYRCALSYAPAEGNKGVVTEQCRRFFGTSGFRNTYWTENDRIVCSIQWFHPDADMLQFFDTAEQARTLDLRRQGC